MGILQAREDNANTHPRIPGILRVKDTSARRTRESVGERRSGERELAPSASEFPGCAGIHDDSRCEGHNNPNQIWMG